LRHGRSAGLKSILFSIKSFTEFFLVHQYVIMISGFWLCSLMTHNKGKVKLLLPSPLKGTQSSGTEKMSVVGEADQEQVRPYTL
jgi:hypothetical protein